MSVVVDGKGIIAVIGGKGVVVVDGKGVIVVGGGSWC